MPTPGDRRAGRLTFPPAKERQAVRRFDEGTLSTAQEDRLGTALMLLDERMDDLCAQHGLSRSDLNLGLGPLGSLLADPEP
ncbi:gas vesicle protein K [Streptomyces olivaceus]